VRTDKVAFVVVLAAAALSACESRPLLRDWYVGRETLEPGLYVQTIERDAWGDPILPPQAR
jgi:hypothetical protein